MHLWHSHSRSGKSLRSAASRWLRSLLCAGLTGLSGAGFLDAGEIRLLPPIREAAKGGGRPIEVRHAFAGEAAEIRGLVSGEVAKMILDLHRTAGATAVPLGEQVVPVPGGPGASEVVARVDLPESPAPVKYLARLWNEDGDKRSLLASVWVHAVPRAYLPGLSGRSILAVGFDGTGAGEAWAADLRGAGAVIEWSDTLPAAPLEADWILVRGRPAAAALAPGDLREGQVLVYFDDSDDAATEWAVDRIVESPGKGRVVTVPLEVLSGFHADAACRVRLLRLLSDFP